MFFKSIRFSLTLWYSLTLAIILILFSSFFYLSIRKQFYQGVDRELFTIAEALASPTMEPFRDSAPSVFDQVLEDFIGPKVAGKYVRLFDSNGAVTASSKNLQDIRFPLGRAALREARLGRVGHWTESLPGLNAVRTITFPVLTDGRLTRIIQVGSSLGEISDTLHNILVVLGISIPLAILLFGYGGWFLAGVALRPVDLITRSAKKITAENLGHRLEVVNPRDEIGQLAATFNDTLARLENSFKRTRQFSVDVSHELRTPLTILRGETELGLKLAKEPDEFRELLQSNLDEIKKMSKIMEDLLFLSKAEEGGLYLDLQDVELHEFFQELVQQAASLASLARDCGVSLVFEGTAPVYVKGDRVRLRQIFLNLLENGVMYNRPGGEVRLVLSSGDGEARVSVIDTGVGIPEEDLPFIFDRFYRVDKARNRASGGSGLGLSLAKSFVVAHGGKIDAASTFGEGSEFTVHLPLVEQTHGS
ncbi:MAG TPA: ATP-binding protein [Geobacteraceae bacterium]